MENCGPSPAPFGDETEAAELIRRAKDGDPDALGQLIEQCRPYLLAIANAEIDSGILGKVGASDIVQTSLLSAHRCIQDFRGECRQELLAWLRSILVHDLKQTRRYFHAEKRQVDAERPLAEESRLAESAQLSDNCDSPSSVISEREQEEHLYRALDGLSAAERQVIDLRNWQRLSFVEIGQEMNRSADAARKLWSRAIVRLQQRMDQPDA